MRFSQQRDAILQALQRTRSHPTAEWIYEEVQKEIPHLSLGTVYRNLNQLTDTGVIQRIFDNGCVRYDGNTSRHDHFRCDRCGKIFDLDIHVPSIEQKIPAALGFQVTGYSLEISGQCRECQTTNRMNNKGVTQDGS